MNLRPLYTAALALLLTGCSMSQMVVRTSTPMLDGGITAMNHETDLVLAKDAIPASLKMLEGMLEKDPGNGLLREYAAQGFYGYGYGFVEDDDPRRASALYRRGFDHAQQALRAAGLKHRRAQHAAAGSGNRRGNPRPQGPARVVLGRLVSRQMDRYESR